jgi:hypothetical protein
VAALPKPAKVVGSLLAAEKIIWNGVQHSKVDVDFKKKNVGVMAAQQTPRTFGPRYQNSHIRLGI